MSKGRGDGPPWALRSGLAISLTLALHLLAWWALRSSAPRVTPPSTAPRVALRLIPRAPTSIPRDEPAPVRRDAPRLHNAPRPIRQPDRDPSTPVESAPPALFEPAAITLLPPRPLDLSLPSRRAASAPTAMRDQVMNDPRANTPRLTPGERFARSLGSDPTLTEQAMGDGRVIVRRGRECYDVRTAHNANLDPFNQSYRPSQRVVGDCSER